MASIHSENREQRSLHSGDVSQQRFTSVMAAGLINPFSVSSRKETRYLRAPFRGGGQRGSARRMDYGRLTLVFK